MSIPDSVKTATYIAISLGMLRKLMNRFTGTRLRGSKSKPTGYDIYLGGLGISGGEKLKVAWVKHVECAMDIVQRVERLTKTGTLHSAYYAKYVPNYSHESQCSGIIEPPDDRMDFDDWHAIILEIESATINHLSKCIP